MTDDNLRTRWYMGWACTDRTPLPEQLRIAVQHFCRRHGRLPAVVAVHRKDGITPPPGIILVEAAWVHEGHLHLYF